MDGSECSELALVTWRGVRSEVSLDVVSISDPSIILRINLGAVIGEQLDLFFRFVFCGESLRWNPHWKVTNILAN